MPNWFTWPKAYYLKPRILGQLSSQTFFKPVQPFRCKAIHAITKAVPANIQLPSMSRTHTHVCMRHTHSGTVLLFLPHFENCFNKITTNMSNWLLITPPPPPPYMLILPDKYQKLPVNANPVKLIYKKKKKKKRVCDHLIIPVLSLHWKTAFLNVVKSPPPPPPQIVLGMDPKMCIGTFAKLYKET